MKIHARIVAIAGLVALLGGIAAHAQSGALTGRVPFSFTAGAVAFAPGTYTISRNGMSQQVIVIRGASTGALFMTQGGGSASATQEKSRLVFHRYGDRYFLREVWFLGMEANALPETVAEREAKSGPDQVALKRTIVIVEAASD